jgi:hypothetical protein
MRHNAQQYQQYYFPEFLCLPSPVGSKLGLVDALFDINTQKVYKGKSRSRILAGKRKPRRGGATVRCYAQWSTALGAKGGVSASWTLL